MSDERPKDPVKLDPKMEAVAKRATARVLAALGLPTEEEQVLEALRERQARLKREREEALEIVRELDLLPRAQARLLCRNKSTFHTWGLCETLLRAAWGARFESARDACYLAELGVLVSEKLDPEVYGRGLVFDLQARALGYLGNALRIGGEYDEAREYLERAQAVLDRGTGDPLEEGQLLEFQGILEWYTGDFYAAHKSFDRALALYRDMEDDHLVGTVLAEKAAALNQDGQFDLAIEMGQQALELLDFERDPRRYMAARVNLAVFLMDDARAPEALPLLQTARLFFEEIGDRLSLARVDWTEARIVKILRDPSEAALLFRSARDELIAQGIGYDAAEITVELAQHYLANGRLGDLQRLAEEILPILPLDGVHDHLATALLMLKDKCEKQQINAFFLDELGHYLFRCRGDREEPFAPRATPDQFL